eukprot:809822-Lingulodinium_polyedra.AAC.1
MSDSAGIWPNRGAGGHRRTDTGDLGVAKTGRARGTLERWTQTWSFCAGCCERHANNNLFGQQPLVPPLTTGLN